MRAPTTASTGHHYIFPPHPAPTIRWAEQPPCVGLGGGHGPTPVRFRLPRVSIPSDLPSYRCCYGRPGASNVEAADHRYGYVTGIATT